jgi:hypothetical protein
VEKGSDLKPALEAALKANQKGQPAVIDVVVGLDMLHFKRAE